MKKHWKIKPWMFIVAILVVAGSLFYALGNFATPFQSTNMDYSYKGDMMSATPEMAVAQEMYEESAYVRAADVDYDDESSSKERMIVRTGFISMIVDDVRESAKAIIEYAEKNGGFLVSSNIDKSGIDLYGQITVRVPSKIFEESTEYIKEMGDIESESVEGRDITEEYTDLEAKLGNLYATEKQFLLILEKAKEIEDVLAVQRELMYVRENIERTEGRIKYLSESVDLSSLTVYLSTDPSELPVVDEDDKWKPIAVIKDALRSLLSTGEEVVNGLIWFVVYLPVIVVLLLIAWAIRRHVRKGKKK